MTPEQFENKVKTLLKEIKLKTGRLLMEYDATAASIAWDNWDTNAYTNDFVGVLYQLQMFIAEYSHITED